MSNSKPPRSKSAGRGHRQGVHDVFRGKLSPRVTDEAKKAAEIIARRVCEKTSPLNLDLKCVVLGVTPRGGFKLCLSRVEVVSDTIISEWKSFCEDLGFTSTITYSAIHAKATIHATPTFTAAKPSKSVMSVFGTSFPAHPLTLLFALLLVANTLRKFVL